MNTQTKNTVPAVGAIRMRDIVGVQIQPKEGTFLFSWCSDENNQRQKLSISRDKFSEFDLVDTRIELNFSWIKEGIIITNQNPFIIYCLKLDGLKGLCLNIDNIPQEELSERPPILLSKGTWLFMKQTHDEGINEEDEKVLNENHELKRKKFKIDFDED